MPMSDNELLAIVNDAERDALRYAGEWIRENEDYLKRYYRMPYGDEVEGQSQVISSDVADVVESDMPSLVRGVLGAKDIMQFEPVSGSDADKREALEKTKYINHIVRNQPDSFKTLHDWMKDAEIQKMGVVRFGYEENERTDTLEYDNFSDDELAQLEVEMNLERKKGFKIEYVGQDTNEDGTNYVQVRKTWIEKGLYVRGVPTEDFIISRNASCEDDAEVIGHAERVTKGELIAAGYDDAMVKGLPSVDNDEGGEDDRSNLPTIRFKSQNGYKTDQDVNHWASELVDVKYLYINVDFDGDGIAERRYIVKAGNRIIENDQFDMVPYAMLSAVLMPHSAIGRGRAEQVMDHQRVNTVLWRQIMDNVYRVNNGRVVVNDEQTNIDDLLTVRPNGIVRTEGDPRSAVAALETPYIGNQALQVVQYIDTLRAQTVGQQITNQGLEADRFHRETATRFEGVQDAAQAKIELVVRCFAETGYKKLFNGLAWFASRYQDEEQEIMVLGQPMTINPKRWTNNNYVSCNVGLAAGDDDKILANMATLLTVQQQLQANGSPLADSLTIYHTLEKMLQAMGVGRINDFINNPEVPAQVLQAQVEQLQFQNMQMQQALQQASNPFLAPEQMRAEAKLIEAEAKQETEIAKILEDQRQFDEKLRADMTQKMADLEAKYTELELKYNQDVPGGRV